MLEGYVQVGNVVRCIIDSKIHIFNSEGEVHLSLGMSLEEVELLLLPESTKKELEKQVAVKKFNENLSLLKEENESYYWDDIPVSIPGNLVPFMHEEKWQKFWRLTSLIRHSKNRENFFNYVKNNNLTVTENGMVVAFRNMCSFNPDKLLEHYQDLRNKKKSTDVFFDDSCCIYPEKVGYFSNSLKGFVENFNKSKKCYRSSHTGPNGKTYYFMNLTTSLPESECDFSQEECSQGIHVHSGKYNSSSYGDVKVAVLINPADVVNAPYQDHSKLRVSAITPIYEFAEDESWNSEKCLEVAEKRSIEYFQEYLDYLFSCYNPEMVKKGSLCQIQKKDPGIVNTLFEKRRLDVDVAERYHSV